MKKRVKCLQKVNAKALFNSLKALANSRSAQVAVFMVIAVVILAAFLFLNYSKSSVSKDKSSATTSKILESKNAGIVRSYAEACIKKIGEKHLFDSIGLQGGYIDASDIPNPPVASFDGKNVPYYIRASCSPSCAYIINIPELDEVSRSISGIIEKEFKNCFDKNAFSGIGISLSESGNLKADTSINDEDVTIRLDYTLVVKEAGNEARIDSFRVVLPIRLKALYESAVDLVNQMKASNSGSYAITLNDCKSFDKNGLTNVYVRSVPGSKIVRFFDYSTYYQKYTNAYIFQFATDADVSGQCTG